MTCLEPALTGVASACPSCKESLHDPASANLARGFYYSILFMVSMPFVNYGGPLGSEIAVRALCDESAQLAEQDGVRLLELRSRVPLSTELAASHRWRAWLTPG